MGEPVTRIGIVGVGTIAVAIVDGLLTSPSPDIDIVLSPRNESRVAELCERFPHLRVATDNQDVLDTCDTVILAVLPSQLPDVCAALRFRPDQVVASLAARWSADRVAPLVAPATTICQVVPLPIVRLHTGPIVMYPDVAPVRELFGRLGDVIVPDSPTEAASLAIASATMSQFFAMQATVVDWLVGRGVAADAATAYVTSLLHGLTMETIDAMPADVHALITEHETPGGLNHHVRTSLERLGAYRGLTAALDELVQP